MKKTMHRVLALVLACLMLTGSLTVGFAANTVVGQVTGLALSARTSTSIKLKWKAVSKVNGYLVERYVRETKSWEARTTTTERKFVDEGLKPGNAYTYRVRAFVQEGNAPVYGKPSDKLIVLTNPESVTELQMISESSTVSSVRLRWTAAAGATNYVVYKKDVTTNGKFAEVGKTKKTTYKVKFPAAPGKVFFKVKSYAERKDLSIGAKSSPALKLNLKPEKVEGLAEKQTTPSSVTLVWEPAKGVTSYEVFMRDEATFEYQLIATVTEPTCVVTGLEPSSVHHFAVKSVADYAGNVLRSGYSETLESTTGFDEITGFGFVLSTGNKAFLSWDELKSASSYEIEQSPDGQNDWNMIAETQKNVFEVSELEPNGMLDKGKKYYYRVRALAVENGETLYTGYTDVAEIHPVPDTPTITRAGTASQHGICLEWTAVKGADGYEIQYSNDESDEWKSLTSALMDAKVFKTYKNEDGVKSVYYLDRGLTQSGTYQYRVRAFVKTSDGYQYTPDSNTYAHNYVYSPEPQKYYTDVFQKTGLVGYLYDPVEGVFFTSEDPWQRSFGFNEIYDVGSQFVYIQYDTVRIKFTCHEGEKWMIQPWKGQYGWLFFGGEVGIYKQYNDRDVEHYDAARDEDKLMMEMDCYRKHMLIKWVKEFHRPYGSYWWITGFKPGFTRFVGALYAQNFDTYYDLRIDLRITMMDYDMRNAFVEAIRKENEKDNRISIQPYGKNDLDLYLSFN